MHSRRVVVLGAGIAGLATALVLARDGHDVTLLERDSWQATSPDEAPGWTRAAVALADAEVLRMYARRGPSERRWWR